MYTQVYTVYLQTTSRASFRGISRLSSFVAIRLRLHLDSPHAVQGWFLLPLPLVPLLLRLSLRSSLLLLARLLPLRLSSLLPLLLLLSLLLLLPPLVLLLLLLRSALLRLLLSLLLPPPLVLLLVSLPLLSAPLLLLLLLLLLV